MKRTIKNPAKWIGKYVRHMANWQEYNFWGIDYFVCEETGKLWTMEDEAYWGEIWETKEEAERAGFDECYWYSKEGLMRLAGRPATS